MFRRQPGHCIAGRMIAPVVPLRSPPPHPTALRRPLTPPPRPFIAPPLPACVARVELPREAPDPGHAAPVRNVVQASDADVDLFPGMYRPMYTALRDAYNRSQLGAILSTFKRHAAVKNAVPVYGSVYRRPSVSELCDVCLVQVGGVVGAWQKLWLAGWGAVEWRRG
jgi:hypothetical protein